MRSTRSLISRLGRKGMGYCRISTPEEQKEAAERLRLYEKRKIEEEQETKPR